MSSGVGADDWLQSQITGNLPLVGRIGLVYFASPKGKVLSEMTMTRVAKMTLLMTGAGAYWHDRDLLNANLPENKSISIADVTRDIATLLVTGPSHQPSGGSDSQTTSSEDFPWLSHQKMRIAGSGNCHTCHMPVKPVQAALQNGDVVSVARLCFGSW